MLAPGSPDAAQVAILSWAMFAAAAVVLVVTLGLLGIAIVLGRRGNQPAGRRTKWRLVVAGGVVAPLVAAVAVFSASLAITDESAGPGGARPGRRSRSPASSGGGRFAISTRTAR